MKLLRHHDIIRPMLGPQASNGCEEEEEVEKGEDQENSRERAAPGLTAECPDYHI